MLEEGFCGVGVFFAGGVVEFWVVGGVEEEGGGGDGGAGCGRGTGGGGWEGFFVGFEGGD